MWPFKRKKQGMSVEVTVPGYSNADIEKALRRSRDHDREVRPILNKFFQACEDLEPAYIKRRIDPRERQKALSGYHRLVQEMPAIRNTWKRDAEIWERQLKLPAYRPAERLAIMYEEVGDFDQAIRICRSAKEWGWQGNWDKRIARCEVKQVKARKKATT
jgi:hypothetical protein